MGWVVLTAVPVLATYWLRIFGRFVDGESERDHVDAVRLGLLGLALAFLVLHFLLLAVAAAALQQALTLRPGLLRQRNRVDEHDLPIAVLPSADDRRRRA